MGPHTSHDPVQEAIARVHLDISRELASLHQEFTDSRMSIATDLRGLESRQRADSDRILDQVKQQTESKLWKIAYIALPVLLGFVVWALQLNTNQKIDSTGKKLAARLALTEEFYKKKLGIYEDADKQMATIVETLKDLGADPGDLALRVLAVDNVRKLSDLSRTNKLFLSEDVSEALADVAFSAAGMTNPHPTSETQMLSEKVADAEEIMTEELQGQMDSLD
jgi:hypothetical protein